MLKSFLKASSRFQIGNVIHKTLLISSHFSSASSQSPSQTPRTKKSSKGSDSQDGLRFIRANLRNRFNLQRPERLRLIEAVRNVDIKKERISLAELKAVFQVLDRDWVGNKNVIEALANVDHNYDYLLSSTKDLLELENMLAPFHYGLVYLEESRKLKIFHKLMTLLNTQRKSLGLISRIFSYLSNITTLSSGEIELLGETTLNLGKVSQSESNFEKSLLYTINSILIQKKYESPYLLEILEILEERPLTDPEIKNMLIFNLEHLKAFVPKDMLIDKCIKGCYKKLPDTRFVRNNEATDSNTQAKIANIMLQEGYMVSQNQEIGVYSIDFLLKPKLVVEYHGYSHYYVNKQEIINQHQMKIDFLKALGYYVQIIPYYEWHDLEKHENQVNYLNEAIYKPFPKV